jgi:uncharacterized protein with HEPN domain
MKPVKPYLEHILEECDFLIEKSKNLNYEKFIKDPVLMKAFVRSLEIIVEAVKKIPTSFKEKHKSIPWKEIAGMRDKLIHDYFGVNYKIVWETTIQEIPKLKKDIEEILKKERTL